MFAQMDEFYKMVSSAIYLVDGYSLDFENAQWRMFPGPGVRSLGACPTYLIFVSLCVEFESE